MILLLHNVEYLTNSWSHALVEHLFLRGCLGLYLRSVNFWIQLVYHLTNLCSLHGLFEHVHFHPFHVGMTCKRIVTCWVCTLGRDLFLDGSCTERKNGNLQVVTASIIEILDKFGITTYHVIVKGILLLCRQQSNITSYFACIILGWRIAVKFCGTDSCLVFLQRLAHLYIDVWIVSQILNYNLTTILIQQVWSLNVVALTLLRGRCICIQRLQLGRKHHQETSLCRHWQSKIDIIASCHLSCAINTANHLHIVVDVCQRLGDNHGTLSLVTELLRSV